MPDRKFLMIKILLPEVSVFAGEIYVAKRRITTSTPESMTIAGRTGEDAPAIIV